MDEKTECLKAQEQNFCLLIYRKFATHCSCLILLGVEAKCCTLKLELKIQCNIRGFFWQNVPQPVIVDLNKTAKTTSTERNVALAGSKLSSHISSVCKGRKLVLVLKVSAGFPPRSQRLPAP